ncbi:unnamed protein product (macronuclear) [Paramecium tetraurelia]|uniref:Generative cell specific-1/HAP2 domain-containing protein n=1 Tax=Paramecium tetraurelia TaxID=5888 RepID=A0BGY9_PARTE|nr:uncharacterized protein GSPATT00028841001 [Paramecium tetraurelia]CAK57806.1 unnamed protein product [Paramecium tetraurelia]|eukprot:XP_001425204.1 hypothetical protein (macronuclear) [Paramecium tetraurelia strain d4-2]
MQYLHLLLVAIACKEIQNKNQQFLTDDGYEDDDDDNTVSIFFLFVFGFFLIIFSAALLWYNERREAITEYRLVNMRDICKLGDCNEINHQLNGELVHMQGQTTTDVIIEDTEFGITLSSCIKLKRHVEQLQFVRIEHKHKKSATTYTYELKWKPDMVCSAGYPSEYQNKPQLWIVKSQDQLNPDVRLGAFTLSQSLKQGCQNFQFLVPDDAQLQAAAKLCGKEFPHITINERDLYLQQHPYQKTVGDLRVCFEYVLCGNATVVSKQMNNTFIPFVIQDKWLSEKSVHPDEMDEDEGCCGDCCQKVAELAKAAEEPLKQIDWIREKQWSMKKVFLMELSKNAALTYKTRFLGYVLMVTGLLFMFYPVIWLFSLLPWIGQFTAALLFFIFLGVSMVISLPICLLIALVAWMRYHIIYTIINFFGLILVLYIVSMFAGGIYY